MQETLDRRPPPPEPPLPPPAPAVQRARRPSAIWLIPLVAVALGAYLVWLNWSQQGPTITITFQSASGLEAGKTPVKYKDVEVGLVEDIKLSEDLSHILVTARMDQSIERFLTEAAQLWVVVPRVGLGGVTGLETLVSGSYIELDPGDASGRRAREFAALEVPPLIRSDVPGTSYHLRASTLGGVDRGAPIFYRGLEVGQVLGYTLAADSSEIDFTVFVQAPHDALIHEHSRFWNASGINLSLGANGVDLSVASLQSLVIGGINVETPAATEPGTPAPEGQVFPLYADLQEARRAGYTTRAPVLAEFEGSLRGLRPGAPVELRGIQIGEVEEIRIAFDPEKGTLKLPVLMRIEPERLGAQAWTQATPEERVERLRRLVAGGLRAQLRSGNLLTGELLVAFDFVPDAAPAEVRIENGVAVIPTVPAALDELRSAVTSALGKLDQLPLEATVDEARRALAGVADLVGSAESREAIAALHTALVDIKTLASRLSEDVGPITTGLKGTLAGLDAAMRAARTSLDAAQGMIAPDSRLRQDLASTLRELSGAARSIRVLADYLERHPEALIRGKTGATQ
jgi:paraquat-inducible protein B